jgi:hypothetical protein
VTAQPGVDVQPSPNVKDELQLSGNNLEQVSQSAADLQQICRVRNKDIRKVSAIKYPGCVWDLANNVRSSLTVCTCRRGVTLSPSKRGWFGADGRMENRTVSFFSPTCIGKQREISKRP